MLKELKFVMGAVAKKDFVPAMTHFKIENGFVRSFNGAMALCSPIAFDINCVPKADELVRAIANCGDTTLLSMTEAGKLRVQSGAFKAFVSTVDGDTPHPEPAGEFVQFDGQSLLAAVKAVFPFIGDDASRPWSNGMLLRGKSAYATNNVCLVEYWIGTQVPVEVNIPRAAIQEMLRIDEPPTHAQMDANSITFHYSDGRWIRTQLLETEWPDLSPVLDVQCSPSSIDPGLFDALDTIAGFADDLNRVYLSEGLVRTHQEDELGASYEVPGWLADGIYKIKYLQLLRDVAQTADFTRAPDPIIFYGKNIRGAIAGMLN